MHSWHSLLVALIVFPSPLFLLDPYMARTITYYYPDETAPSSLKVFQDRSSQIRGFYFTRDRLEDIAKEENASNYAIYFLMGNSDDEHHTATIYIGQSKNGAGRINDHKQKKSFWSHCIMFVSDNNAFDTNVIDYMEYYFIQKVLEAGTYSVENKDERKRRPNVSIYDQPTYNLYIAQIEFLLQVEGVQLTPPTKKALLKYYPLRATGPVAQAYFQDGLFYLEKGSIIRPAVAKSQLKQVKASMARREEQIKSLLGGGKIRSAEEEGFYEVMYPLSFKTPSAMALFVLGRNANGWTEFVGIDELRE